MSFKFFEQKWVLLLIGFVIGVFFQKYFMTSEKFKDFPGPNDRPNGQPAMQPARPFDPPKYPDGQHAQQPARPFDPPKYPIRPPRGDLPNMHKPNTVPNYGNMWPPRPGFGTR